MSRDFETQKRIEEMACWRLEYITGRRFCLAPDEMSPFDMLIQRFDNGVPVLEYLAEFRERPKILITTYPTIVLDVKKVTDIMACVEWFKLPGALYIVQFADGTYWRTKLKPPYPIDPNFARNTPLERDSPRAVYEIPSKDFRQFK